MLHQLLTKTGIKSCGKLTARLVPSYIGRYRRKKTNVLFVCSVIIYNSPYCIANNLHEYRYTGRSVCLRHIYIPHSSVRGGAWFFRRCHRVRIPPLHRLSDRPNETSTV